MNYLQDIYRSMHPEMYFTPDKVMQFVRREGWKREEQYIPDWHPLGNPPFDHLTGGVFFLRPRVP